MSPLALSQYLTDWLDLLLRWLHVIAAMAWVGTSFYFVLVDQSLRAPKRTDDVDEGVAGELWEVHGGGFYRVQKFQVAPRVLPDHLAWFKWEAYTTWLSGFGLMLVLYYLHARATMIDPSVAALEPWSAVTISLALLVAAWVAYDVLNRALSNRPLLLWAALGALVVVAAWGSAELFSPRAAWLQVGAMIGTVMSANVFFVIIPAHWELIRAKEAGREPDPAPAIQAKQRSVHNNYFTLPVLLVMLAGHAPFAFATAHAWLVLLVLMAVGAFVRLFFNLRHTGHTHWWMPVAAGAAVLALAVAIKPDDEPAGTRPPATTDEVAAGRAVFASAGCGGCHTLAAAGTTGNVGPNLDGAKPSEALVRQRVTNGQGAMPSFRTRLDAREIDAVAAYVAAAARG